MSEGRRKFGEFTPWNEIFPASFGISYIPPGFLFFFSGFKAPFSLIKMMGLFYLGLAGSSREITVASPILILKGRQI